MSLYYEHHATKVNYGSGGIAPSILDLGARWRCVVSFTPRPLYSQGKRPWYPLDRRLGRPQSRSGRGGEEKKSLTLPVLEPLIMKPVAQRYTTELSSRISKYLIHLCKIVKIILNFLEMYVANKIPGAGLSRMLCVRLNIAVITCFRISRPIKSPR
jgi:hypothetical protein